MAQRTNIEWTEFNWNFLRGCKHVSEGCRNCYAERDGARGSNPGGPYHQIIRSTDKGPKWTGEIKFLEDILLHPLRRKTPTKYFVNSMSDLFYEKVTDEMIDKAFAVMALCPQHTFQILTKRPERMKAYFDYHNVGRDHNRADYVADQIANLLGYPGAKGVDRTEGTNFESFPLPNVWLGVSVEDQKTADERIPLLLDTPAAIRWISAEPLLGPINLKHYVYRTRLQWSRLDWGVIGGESGPRSRPCDIANIRSVVHQFKSAELPVFVKQLGATPQMANANEWDWPEETTLVEGSLTGFAAARALLKDRKGGDPSEWPEDLRVREYPAVSNELVGV